MDWGDMNEESIYNLIPKETPKKEASVKYFWNFKTYFFKIFLEFKPTMSFFYRKMWRITFEY